MVRGSWFVVREKRRITLGIHFFIILASLVFLSSAYADLPGWSYHATVRITNSVASALTDYQVLVTLNSAALISAGKMQSDGDDIRFLDSDESTQLPYWIESGINSSSTRIWVKVPSIPASSTKDIYLYYGNPAAAVASSGSATFDFFDDFDSLNGAVWTNTGTASAASSQLTVNTGSVYTDATVASSPQDKMVEAKGKWASSTGSYSGLMIANSQATAGSNSTSKALVYYMTQSGSGDMSVYYWAANGTSASYNLGAGSLFTAPLNTDYIMGFVITSSNTIKFYRDYSNIKTITGTWDSPFYLWVGYFTGSASGGTDIKDLVVDWVRVRKFASTEPTAQLYLPVNKLAFTTSERTVTKNEVSQVITVETQSEEGATTAVPTAVTLDLTSTSTTGQFSLSASPFTPVIQATIPANSSSVSFYYRDSRAGIYTITASETPSQAWTDASQNITVLTYSGQPFEEDMTQWLYNATVRITNSNSSTLTDYQILITINTNALVVIGKMQADGDDIRFLDEDNSTQLPYWIEPSTMNTIQTRIWVKVPSIPASSTKDIYLYYGNPAAAVASSGSATFDFFDDFDSLNGAIWTNTGTASAASSQLTVNTGSVYTDATVASSPEDKMVEAKGKWTSSTGSYSGLMIANAQATAGSNSTSKALVYYMTQSGSGDMSVYYWAANGTSASYNLGAGSLFTAALNTDYIMGFVITSSNTIKFYRDYSNIRTITGNWNLPFYLWVGYFTGSASGGTDIKDLVVDWVRVRKFASTEPTAVLILPIAKLAFITAEQAVYEDRASSVITIQTQDDTGSAQNVTANKTINLTSSSGTGQFSLTTSFTSFITSVTIPNGSNSASFYYRDSTAGTHTLTAAESPSLGWSDATQNIIVRAVSLLGNYKKKITITNSLASVLVDFQVLLILDTASLISIGHMQPDGDDIRFLDSDDLTPLFYYIESGINTASTRIWVKVPTIPASSTKDIYLYYGDPTAAAASSGIGTFDFFDDFDSLNGDVWTNTGTVSVASSRLTVNTGCVYTDSTVSSVSQDRFVESKGKWTSSTGSYSGLMIANAQATAGSNSTSKALVYYMTQSGSGDMSVYYWAANGTSASYNLGAGSLFTAALNTDYIMGFVITSSNTIKFYRDYSNIRTITGSWNLPFYLWVGYFTGSASGGTDIKDLVVDWVRVRKFASTEPSTTAAAEESVISQIVFTTTPQTLVQNQSSTMMTVEVRDSGDNTKTVVAQTQIRLESDSSGGRFSEDGSTWSDDNTLTISIPAGGSTASFYYKDSEVGNPIITASEYPSLGWTDATQVQEIKSAVNTFRVEAVTPQVAGKNFILTITAIDDEGNIATECSDAVNLTVNYISPASGSGTLSVTSVSSFVEGVATITNQSFSDCGTITITATKSDDAAKTGTSTNIIFIPYDFVVETEDTIYTVNKVFSLTVTARNAEGQTCPNYKGTANLSAVYVSPSTGQSGTITPSSLKSADFTNGIATLTAANYDKWGTIKIKSAESLDPTHYGESQQLTFIPKDFSVTLSTPPASRDFYYKGEEFIATVTARDENNSTIFNYQGTVELSSSDRSMSSTYTFLPADSGTHNFLLSFASSGNIILTAQDSKYAQVIGQSDTFEIKEAKIKVFSTAGPIGNVAVMVKVLDKQDNVIVEDESTRFTVTLEESNNNDSASCDATSNPTTIQGGSATIYVNDPETETVTITPSTIDYNPTFESISGTVSFGSFKGRGIGVDIWREVK